jgi:hypothetical protein
VPAIYSLAVPQGCYVSFGSQAAVWNDYRRVDFLGSSLINFEVVLSEINCIRSDDTQHLTINREDSWWILGLQFSCINIWPMRLEQAVTPVCWQTDRTVSSLLNVFMSMGWDCVCELLPQRAYYCLTYWVVRVAGLLAQLLVSWAESGTLLSVCLIKHQVIYTYGVWRYNSMHSSALDEVSVSFTSRPLYTRYPLDRRLGGPQSRLVRKMESFACVRHAASQRTRWASCLFQIWIPVGAFLCSVVYFNACIGLQAELNPQVSLCHEQGVEARALLTN